MIAHLIFVGEPGFPHESNHPSVVDEIEARSTGTTSIVALRSFDVGVARSSGGDGLPTGSAHAKPFSGVKQLGCSSPALLKALDQTSRYGQVELELRGPDPAGTGQDTVLATYLFTNVTLGGVGWSGAGDPPTGSDRIAFNYTGIRLDVDGAEAETTF